MKILVDSTKLMVPYNGSWRFGIEVIRALVSQHDVTLAFPHAIDETTLPTDLQKLSRIIGKRWRHISSWSQMWWEVVGVPRLSQHFDLVIAPYFSLSGMSGRPNIVISVLDIWPMRTYARQKAFVRTKLLELSARRGAYIWTISSFSQKEISEVFQRRSDVVFLGADERFEESGGFEDRLPQILYVGGYDERKQVAFLIEALLTVRRWLPSDWKLTLVGDVPQDLMSRVAQFEPHIQRVGLVDDNSLAGLYGESRVFVYPSIYEGFGLPPLEAMSYGTPPIVRNVASLPEVVGPAGIVVSKHDRLAFGKAIVMMLTDGRTWTDYHVKCQDRASQLTWGNVHRRVQSLVFQMATRSREKEQANGHRN